jgi:hypothetical protein
VLCRVSSSAPDKKLTCKCVTQRVLRHHHYTAPHLHLVVNHTSADKPLHPITALQCAVAEHGRRNAVQYTVVDSRTGLWKKRRPADYLQLSLLYAMCRVDSALLGRSVHTKRWHCTETKLAHTNATIQYLLARKHDGRQRELVGAYISVGIPSIQSLLAGLNPARHCSEQRSVRIVVVVHV